MAVNPLSRREVMKFGAFTTVGGVLTPGISLAQAIATDTRGILARDIELSVSGTKIPAYREGLMFGKAQPELAKISASIGRKQYLGDVRAAADFAKSQAWARPDRLGVTGFCGGGALTLHFSAENPDVTAAVPWYGHVKRVYIDAPGLDAFAVASRIKAPVLGLYGDADQGIPSADVKAFEAELNKTNPNVDFVLYPEAPHAFFSDDRPQVYRKAAAEDAWKRCLAFFDKHLKA